MVYRPKAPLLRWNDRFYMLRKKVFKFGARFAPYLPLRVFCLRRTGVVVGESVYIGEDLIVSEVLEDRKPALVIGDRVAIAQRVTIVAEADPNYSRLGQYFQPISETVVLEQDSWIGVGAIILPGVRIGEAAVVGAGAVVTKDVPAFTVVGGVPAKALRRVSPESERRELRRAKLVGRS